MYDYSKLLGRIVEMHFTQEALAEEIGVSGAALRNKLKGKTQFKQDEILKLTKVLSLNTSDIVSYFFSA